MNREKTFDKVLSISDQLDDLFTDGALTPDEKDIVEDALYMICDTLVSTMRETEWEGTEDD